MAFDIFLLEVILSGLMTGVMYALVALGFVLIFKASGIFNFAQGVMALFAGGTVVNGKWAHTSPSHLSGLAKNHPIISHTGPPVKQTLYFGNLYHLITASTCRSKSRQSVE